MKTKGLIISLIIVSFLIVLLLIYLENNSNYNLIDLSKKSPKLGPVPVGVTLGNSPPIIVSYWKVYDVPALSAPPFNLPGGTTYNLIISSSSQVYVGFVAQDPNGKTDLPDLPLSTPALPNIDGLIQSPQSQSGVIGGFVQNPFVQCNSIDCDTGIIPGGIPTGLAPFPTCSSNPATRANQKAYLCSVTMQYFNPPSTFSAVTPNVNDLWLISTQITDNSGDSSPAVTTGQTGFNTLPNDGLSIANLNAADPAVGSTYNWPTLSLTGTNQPSNSPVTIENLGNTALTQTDITGADLCDTTNGCNPPNANGATIAIAAFSASGNSGGTPTPAECDVPAQAVQLDISTNPPVTIPNGGVPYTGQGSSVDTKNIWACVYQTPNNHLTGTATTFSATWQIDLLP